MIIEIRKAGFLNKGAELMLHATLQRMHQEFPEAIFVMAPSANNGSAPFSKRAELGLLQKASLFRYGIQWGGLAALIPTKLREMYGMVLDMEIDVVIDAAGFSYSDQWGYRSTMELAQSSGRWRKRGTKIILLPQALGPFTSQKIKDAITMVADNADFIFARERVSYDYLVRVAGERPNIKMAPDFTNLIEGIVPDYFEIRPNRFCIVPNYRMIDKTSRDQSEAYLPFMINCTKYLQAKGAAPFVLVHEGEKDLMLAQIIRESTGGNLPIFRESNPLKIKGILGACEGTIGSRFHGLVSALSQGVPSLATGWSHKYQMLFEDYGFSDGLLDSLAGEDEMRCKIDLIVDPESRRQIQETLHEKSQLLKQFSEQMWQDVLQVIRKENKRSV